MVSIGPHHAACGYPQCVCCCRNLYRMELRMLAKAIVGREEFSADMLEPTALREHHEEWQNAYQYSLGLIASNSSKG